MSKILVVDDIQTELELISEYLTSNGHTVITALDGKEALQRATRDLPDLIVTDWMMPNMGGLDLCRKLRKKSETANIPVIACTAKNREVDRMWAMKQGVAAYLTKPCTKEELINAVNLIME